MARGRAAMAALVTEEMRRAYERDGYVVVRQLLSSEQTSELKAAVLSCFLEKLGEDAIRAKARTNAEQPSNAARIH